MNVANRAGKVSQGITRTYFVAYSGCTKCVPLYVHLSMHKWWNIYIMHANTHIIDNRTKLCPDVQKDTNYSVSHSMFKHGAACCYKHFQPNIFSNPQNFILTSSGDSKVSNHTKYVRLKFRKLMHKNLQHNISFWWILNIWHIWTSSSFNEELEQTDTEYIQYCQTIWKEMIRWRSKQNRAGIRWVSTKDDYDDDGDDEKPADY